MFRCRQNGASGPTQIARRAALKAKREAAAHLAAIRDEVERRVAELELQLEDRRKVSGDLVSSAQPLQAQLADVQDLAKEWVHRGSAPAGDPTPHAAQTTPGPAPMAMA